jgi:hypothetical protein
MEIACFTLVVDKRFKIHVGIECHPKVLKGVPRCDAILVYHNGFGVTFN